MSKNKWLQEKTGVGEYIRFIAGGKRLIWVLSGVAAIVILSVFIKSAHPTNSNKNISTFKVRKDNLPVIVTESGNIKARNSINIKSSLEGQATIISIVPEGTYITPEDVNNGKILVELDSSKLVEQLAQKEMDFSAAEASYTEAKESYAIKLKQNESDISAAEMEVRFALLDFKKYVGEEVADGIISDANKVGNIKNTGIASYLEDARIGGVAMQDLNRKTDDITLAEAELARAIDKLKGTQELYDANYVAEIELKADKLDQQSLEIRKIQAETSLKLFRRYEFPKEAETLLSKYYEAGRKLERTLASARSILAQAEANLKNAESLFQLKKNTRDRIKKQIEACVIRAPSPGLVIYSSSTNFWRHMDRPIEAGASVFERQDIMSLPDTSGMIVQISVHESSVDKVRPGQNAKIIVDAFPDRTFYGKVLKVAPLPDPQMGWLNPDLKTYNTEVSIDGSHDCLKPGMSAKAEILVEQLNNVLIAPVQVVANRGGKKVCYCMTGRGPEQREVETGVFNDTFVQITNGLKAGEEVLLNPPRIIEAAPAASSEKPQKPFRKKAKEPDTGKSTQNERAPSGPPADRK